MSSDIAICDTCFLIDWARYRRRGVLFELFKVVYVPEEVLREIVSEDTLAFVAEAISKKKLALFTSTREVVEEARRVMDFVNSLTWARGIELPEAICLATGRLYGYTVITENRGALQAKDVVPGYAGVRVWRSLEVLCEAIKRRIIAVEDRDGIERVFREYEEDTKHIFPRRDLRKAVEEVERYVVRGDTQEMGGARRGSPRDS